MDYCVSGSSGQLGDELRTMLQSQGHGYLGIDLNPSRGDLQIDITKADQLQNLFEKNEFEWFIHTAAYTDVDGCEKNRMQAEQVNSDSVEIIAKLCEEHNRKLCLISTDYVFDGEVGNYDEDAQTNPIQHYGITKLSGEEKLLRSGIDHLIMRTSVLWSKSKNNFVTWLMRELGTGGSIRLAQDQVVCPTSTETLGSMVLHLTSENRFGLFNASGKTPLSRFEIGMVIKEKFNLGGSITPCSIRDFDFAAIRPENSSLDTSKICQYIKPVSFEDSLEVF